MPPCPEPCQHTATRWLAATVVAVRGYRVLIHYEGYPQYFDEWMDMNSERLRFGELEEVEEEEKHCHDQEQLKRVHSDTNGLSDSLNRSLYVQKSNSNVAAPVPVSPDAMMECM